MTKPTSSIFDYCLSMTSADGYPAPQRGKVRDVYTLENNRLAIVVTDRISAFDHIMAETIPFKGQILNRLAAFSMEKVSDIVPTHLLSVPHPNITIAHKCEPLPVEVVVRGYLAGHAWRVYSSGERVLCGQKMPEGLRKNEAFPTPLLTPTTKEAEGHDTDITPEEIVKRGLVKQDLWNEVAKTALRLFNRGSKIAGSRGLILVDTKYEFGLYNGKLMLIDEVHTADSSRYYYKNGYAESLETGEPPIQLSKEFLREWLIDKDFMGKSGQNLPSLPDSFRIRVYEQYKKLFQILTGEVFTPVYTPDFDKTLTNILAQYK